VGKAPYGYRPIQIRLTGTASSADPGSSDDEAVLSAGGGHRGKGRAGPRTKTRLVVEPVEAGLVRRICTLRVGERLGYQAIADRLNTDTALNQRRLHPTLRARPGDGRRAASATCCPSRSTPATWYGTGGP